MKRGRWLAIAVGVAGFFALSLGVVNAQSFRSGVNATVGTNETVNSSVWVAGNNVDIAGTVNGDVFCAGQTVTVSGTVNGDVICAAQTIDVSGTVEGDIRVAGQTVTVSGSIGKNASVAGQTVTFSSKSSVGGDLSTGGNSVILNGNVGRDVALGGTTVQLNGEIKRTVQGQVQDMSLGSNARIGGDLRYTSANDAEIANGAVVSGETVKTAAKEPKTREFGTALLGLGIGAAITLLVAALVLVAIFPQVFQAVSNRAIERPGISLLTGLIASAVVPVLTVLLFITIVGIPLALLLILAWLLVMSLSGAFTAYWVGRMIWRDQRNVVLIMLAGALLLLIVYFIPVIGLIAMLLAFWWGTGMLLLEAKHLWPNPQYELTQAGTTTAVKSTASSATPSRPRRRRATRRR